MGRRTGHAVTQVWLDLEDAPAQAVNIRYEFRPQLVRLGILPANSPLDPLQRRERSRGFEPGFSPNRLGCDERDRCGGRGSGGHAVDGAARGTGADRPSQRITSRISSAIPASPRSPFCLRASRRTSNDGGDSRPSIRETRTAPRAPASANGIPPSSPWSGPAPSARSSASGRFANGHSLISSPRNFLNSCTRLAGVKPLRVRAA